MGEALDWGSLENYLRKKMHLKEEPMAVQQFHGGHANLSYLLKFGQEEFVLRRPPFGKIAPGAHDMKREFNVLSRLHKVYPRAPRAYLYCDNMDIIGAPFVIIERRKGIVVRYKIPEVFRSYDGIEERLSRALVLAQTDLHKVDFEKAGLDQLGSAEGFLNRQVAGWFKRWSLSSKNEDPVMSEIIEQLKKSIPDTQMHVIIHNDFKLDNCQFDSDNPDEVKSVFDWDMATIGDPLFDFASSLVYWQDSFFDDYDIPVLLAGHFPDKAVLKDIYFEEMSLKQDDFEWYEAFAFWKTAVISRQLFNRYQSGDTKDKRLAKFGNVATAFADKALKILKQKG